MTERIPDPDSSQPVFPYAERSGVKTEDYLAEILSEPEIVLTDSEQEQLKSFSVGLFIGHYSQGPVEIHSQSNRNLEELYQTSPLSSSQEFYLGYFETEKGRAALSQLGIESSDVGEIAKALYDTQQVKSRLSAADRKKIAADSLNWYKAVLADQLQKPSDHDSRYQDPSEVSVNYDPEKLISKIEDLQAYRNFYRLVLRANKDQPDSSLAQAQEILLSVHRGRVNEMIAGLYSSVISLAAQFRKSEEPSDLQTRLGEAMPAVRATFLQAREDRVYDLETLAGNFSRRLDFIRNGAAWTGSDDFSPISSELAVMAEQLKDETKIVATPSIPSELVEKLNSERWDASRMKDLAEAIIGEWGLLSTEQSTWTEVEERDGFASDKKWQVIISPKVKGMSISGAKRTLKIPESFDRSLIQEDPAGVIPGLSHELTHLIQNEAAYIVSDEIPLAKIKGRRVSTIKELGTLTQEGIAHEKFGGKKLVNTHYLSALRVKLAGGNKVEAARAFYDSYASGRQLGPEEAKKARELAADRILRFYRHGGHESQPLDYIEQELLNRKMVGLSQADKDRILILGSIFDLPDLAKLSRVGLGKFPEGLPYGVADEVWRIFDDKYLPAITNESSSA